MLFWIGFMIAFVAVCTALVLLVRNRGGGGIRGEATGVDNRNALQKGAAQVYRQNISNGPGTPPGV